jgi:prolyl 4-hydroxylase
MMASLLDLKMPLYFTVDGVLSPSECAALIARIEAASPTLAPITTARGPLIDTETRNNSRVMFDDPALAAQLYERILPHVPAEVLGMRVASANERLRCYKYGPGQWFKPHYDGAFHRSDSERSLYTFMVYLNEGFAGGDTSFLDLRVDVRPKTGRALLFQHPILHEGCEVTRGVKFVVRSDIMYRKG